MSKNRLLPVNKTKISGLNHLGIRGPYELYSFPRRSGRNGFPSARPFTVDDPMKFDYLPEISYISGLHEGSGTHAFLAQA